jgi:hypothetical protein
MVKIIFYFCNILLNCNHGRQPRIASVPKGRTMAYPPDFYSSKEEKAHISFKQWTFSSA